MPKIESIKDLIPFLAYLRRNKVGFQLASDRDDSVMVTLGVYGERIEVDFFDDHIEYSQFTGDESVKDDLPALFKTIADFIA